MHERPDIRNVAIIAHVDHGKTTLVDAMLWQTGIFRDNEEVVERVMDSNDLEREKGITILAKNTAVRYGGVKINIVDTPGHADFGGEVERTPEDGGRRAAAGGRRRGPAAADALRAQEGARARAAAGRGHQQDRPRRTRARPRCWTRSTTSSSTWTPTRTSSTSRSSTPSPATGIATPDLGRRPDATLKPLFDDDPRHHAPAPLTTRRRAAPDAGRPTSTTTTTSAASPSAASSTAASGQARPRRPWCTATARVEPAKVTVLYGFEGLKRVEVAEARRRRHRGPRRASRTSTSATPSPTPSDPRPLPRIRVDEPTVIDDVLGQQLALRRPGGQVRHLPQAPRAARARDAAPTWPSAWRRRDTPDTFNVSGRGELQLAILIETMRREGYELAVGKPEVITRDRATA